MCQRIFGGSTRYIYISRENPLLYIHISLGAMSCVTKRKFFRQWLITSFKKHADKYSKYLKFRLVIS